MNKTMTAALLYGALDIRVEQMAWPIVDPQMVLLRIRRVGICGSDLHYFQDGFCGSFKATIPFVLGHECTADVIDVGSAVNKQWIGRRVVVNPAGSCGVCEYCARHLQNLCVNTIMLGSASTNPPTNGAMAGLISVRYDQCFVLPDDLDDATGAMIEPFAVALHATKRAGVLSNKKILVTGGGTIGLLTALTAQAMGARKVVLSDIYQERRAYAVSAGIEHTSDPLDETMTQKLQLLTGVGFDVVFEASGAKEALTQSFELVRPHGTIVQIGTLGRDAVPLPANQIMTKELHFIGSFRYANVFEEAIQLAASGAVNLRQFVTAEYPFADITSAFHAAGDKINALKVQVIVTT